MNKIVSIFVLLLVLSTTSCLKSYNCQCRNTMSMGPHSAFLQSTKIKSPVKKDAEKKCDEIEDGAASEYIECTLESAD